MKKLIFLLAILFGVSGCRAQDDQTTGTPSATPIVMIPSASPYHEEESSRYVSYRLIVESASSDDPSSVNEYLKMVQDVRITQAEANLIASDERVKSINAISYTPLPYSLYDTTATAINFNAVVFQEELDNRHVFMQALHFEEALEFSYGAYELLEGRRITQDEIDQGKKVVMITDELAYINHLELGDVICVMRYDAHSSINMLDRTKYAPTEIEFLNLEIVGIYQNHANIPEDISEEWVPNSDAHPQNVILIPSNTLHQHYLYVENALNQQLNSEQVDYGYYYSDVELKFDELIIELRLGVDVDEFTQDLADLGVDYRSINLVENMDQLLGNPAYYETYKNYKSR